MYAIECIGVVVKLLLWIREVLGSTLGRVYGLSLVLIVRLVIHRHSISNLPQSSYAIHLTSCHSTVTLYSCTSIWNGLQPLIIQQKLRNCFWWGSKINGANRHFNGPGYCGKIWLCSQKPTSINITRRSAKNWSPPFRYATQHKATRWTIHLIFHVYSIPYESLYKPVAYQRYETETDGRDLWICRWDGLRYHDIT
jgi:hypothetical protein